MHVVPGVIFPEQKKFYKKKFQRHNLSLCHFNFGPKALVMENRKHFLHCNIAGFSYYEGAIVFKELAVGTELSLKIEPDNRFDPHAVEVYYGQTKLGYLPADKNKIIHLLLEMGHDIFETRIQKLDPTAHPENQVQIIVYVKKWGEGVDKIHHQK